MRILVVEDREKLAVAIKKGLEQENYAVDVNLDGQEGLDSALSTEYDLIILDRMLPNKSGTEIITELRSENIETPVIFLTAKDSPGDKVEGLDAGADDYLVKPFVFDELVARIRALLRRPKNTLKNELTYKDLKLNLRSLEVTRGESKIDLTKKEFALLEYLMRNAETPISKEKLIEHVWDFDSNVLPNNVEVFIGYLRTKIDKPFSDKPSLINTKRGFGYVFGVVE